MDMLANTSNYLNTSLTGSYGWGSLDGKLYWQNVHHYMNFLAERAGTSNMPMNTNGTDEGYSLKAEIPLDKTDLLRVGNELHAYSLSDWWPPGSAGMTPGTFRNINNGERNVLGTYAELEKQVGSGLDQCVRPAQRHGLDECRKRQRIRQYLRHRRRRL